MTYTTITQWQAQLSEEFNELRPNLLKIQKIIEIIAALEADLLVTSMSASSKLLIDSEGVSYLKRGGKILSLVQ